MVLICIFLRISDSEQLFMCQLAICKMSFQFLYPFWGASQVALVVKNPPANAGDRRDVGSIPRLGDPLEGVHGNPLWYSCLENPMDRQSQT